MIPTQWAPQPCWGDVARGPGPRGSRLFASAEAEGAHEEGPSWSRLALEGVEPMENLRATDVYSTARRPFAQNT
eukprot:409936-Pyramimonas_sp.AAC.1